MESSSIYSPQDLLEEILKRLPVKTIIRFKCVNKSWYTLFEDPIFIYNHNGHHSSQTNPTLLVENVDGNTLRSVMSLHPADGLDLGVSLYMPFFQDKLDYISDCINGIICISDYPSLFILWNPAIREHKVIPERPSPVSSPANIH